MSLKELTEKTELKSSVRVYAIGVPERPFCMVMHLTEWRSLMRTLFEIMKFKYNIDLLWSWTTFRKVLGSSTLGFIPKKVPFSRF